MLEIATAEGALPGEQAVLGVDDCELERGGVSYTIQTMEEIVRDYRPSGRPGLIIGDDLVEGFGGWREPERLAEIADIVVARRALEATPSFPYRHLDVCNLRLPISSRLIRGRLRAGLPVRFLVPDAVLHYIESHGLYRPHSAQAAATPRPGHADAAGASSAHPWEPCP
jgi:nicotinate-nucleotide adenylyltransferase